RCPRLAVERSEQLGDKARISTGGLADGRHEAPVSGSLSASPVVVRAFQAADRGRVLEILEAAFGRWPRGLDGVAPGEFFGWKHEQSPFGPSILLVAEADDALVGFLALMPWQLSLD